MRRLQSHVWEVATLLQVPNHRGAAKQVKGVNNIVLCIEKDGLSWITRSVGTALVAHQVAALYPTSSLRRRGAFRGVASSVSGEKLPRRAN